MLFVVLSLATVQAESSYPWVISGSESLYFQPVMLGAEGISDGPGREMDKRPVEVLVGLMDALFQVKEVYDGDAAM